MKLLTAALLLQGVVKTQINISKMISNNSNVKVEKVNNLIIVRSL